MLRIRNWMDVRFFVRKPLACQTWPVEGMSNDNVVEIWRILLPTMGVNDSASTAIACTMLHTMFCIPKKSRKVNLEQGCTNSAGKPR